MSLRIVKDGGVIKAARDQIIAAFERHGAEPLPTVVGHPGGNQKATAYWASDLGIWLATKLIEKSRYWNAFGTSSPQPGKMVQICCEINFPLSGINRQISGGLAQDDRGNLFLVHRGRIGGGRKGVGPELFWRHYCGKPSLVVGGDRDSEFALVGALESPRFLRQIRSFVKEVERIKEVARLAETVAVQGEGIEIQDIGEEFDNPKAYIVARTIEASCDHAVIVRCLRRNLGDLGYTFGKDRLRDLYIHRDKQITTLFEVKPDTSTTSVYTAVGQLMLYSVTLPRRPKLVFVAPAELGAGVRKNLAKIGVDVLSYRWTGPDVEFADLQSFSF